jgi:hypothetical protein
MPLYRIKPLPKTAPGRAEVVCEDCGAVLGDVGWRVDVGVLVPASYVRQRWSDLAKVLQKHDCGKEQGT